jgi:large subunit ribosomal protein L7Ae
MRKVSRRTLSPEIFGRNIDKRPSGDSELANEAVKRMPKSFYVKFEVPKELADKALQVVQVAKDSGKLRKGTNESTKAVERAVAKLVLIAEDVDPPQVVAHLPILCEERKIPYLFVPSKLDLGRAAGIDVGCAAVTVLEGGEGAKTLKEVADSTEQLKKSGAKGQT